VRCKLLLRTHLSSWAPGALHRPAHRCSRGEGPGRGRFSVRARQRSPLRGPRLPWGPHPAAL